MALDILKTFEDSRGRLIERTRDFERAIARKYKLESEAMPDAKGVDLATLTKWNALPTRGRDHRRRIGGQRTTRKSIQPAPPTTSTPSPPPDESTSRNPGVKRMLDLSAKNPNDPTLQNWVKRRNEAVEGGLQRVKSWKGGRGG